MSLKGQSLYDLLIELSGLDRQVAESELGPIIARLGLKIESLKTDDVQSIMMAYLEDFSSQEAADHLEASRNSKPILKSRIIGEA